MSKEPGEEENSSGVTYLNAGNHLLAAEKFKAAIAKSPKTAQYIFNLGQAYYELEDYHNAKEQFKKYVEMEPTNAVAYSYIGASYDSLNDQKNTLKYFHLASEYDNVSTIYYWSLGALYMYDKQFDKSIPYFQRAIEYAIEDEDIEDYHSSFGEMYVRMGRPQMGLEIATKGYKSGYKPNFGIAFASYKLKKYADAIRHYSVFVAEKKKYYCTSPYYLALSIWKSGDKGRELTKVIELLTASIQNCVKVRHWTKSHFRRGEIYLFYCSSPELALNDFKYFVLNYEKCPISWRFSNQKKFEYAKNLVRILESSLPEIKDRNKIHFQVNSLNDWKKLLKESDVDKGVELKDHLQTMISNNLNIYDLDINSNTLLHWIANHILSLTNDNSNPKVLAKIALTFDIISLITQRKIPMANNQGALPLDLLFNSGDQSQRSTRTILVNKYKSEAMRRMIFKPNPPPNSDLLDIIVKMLKQVAGEDLLTKGKNITNFLIGQVFTDELKTSTSLESDYLLVYLAHLISIQDNNENLNDFVDKERLFNTNSEIFFALRLRMFVQIIVHLFNALSLPSSLRNDKSQIINNLIEECAKFIEMIEIHRLQTSIRINGNKEIWLRCLAIRVTQKIKQLKLNERYLLHSSFNTHNIFIEYHKVNISHYNIAIYNFGEGSSQYHEMNGQKILPFVCRVPVAHFDASNISPIIFNFLKSNSGVMNLQEYLNLIYCSFPDTCSKLNQRDIELSFKGRRPKNRNNSLVKTYQCVLQNSYQSKEFFNWIRVAEFQLLPLGSYFNENNILSDNSRDVLSRIDKNKLKMLLSKSEKLDNPSAYQNNTLLKFISTL